MNQNSDKLFYSSFYKDNVDLIEAKVCVVCIALDNSSHFQHGTHKGPQAILRASQYLEDFDFDTRTSLQNLKIHTMHIDSLPTHTSEALKIIGEKVDAIPATAWPLFLGGEQTLVRATFLKTLKTVADKEDVSILYLDSHADCKKSYQGSSYSHRCTARGLEELAPSIVIAGLRDASEGESLFLDSKEDKYAVFTPGDLLDPGGFEALLRTLKKNVYISIDLSVLDPATCPAVSHPEPSGISFANLTALLKLVFAERQVIGADICELCPTRSDVRSEYLTAKLAQKILGYSNSNPG